jgi:hypothetical protein
MRPKPVLGLLALLALSAPLPAQTTTYSAPTGSVSSTLQVTMNLTGGGSAFLNPVVGPNCYLGMTCGFPAGYVGTYMSYTLADGTTATLPNFSGTFFPVGGNNYEISGQASGTDSAGRSVSVDTVQVTMGITCRSGRGGGCSKVYTGGTMTVTLNAMVTPATPTPTATATVTTAIGSTATPAPAIGSGVTVGSVRIRRTTDGTSASGWVKVKGSFLVPAADGFDASEGIAATVQATGFNASHAWAADDCLTDAGNTRCLSADKSARVKFTLRATPTGTLAFTLSLHKLPVAGPFAGPVTVTLTEASTGTPHTGAIATCATQGPMLLCKP